MSEPTLESTSPPPVQAPVPPPQAKAKKSTKANGGAKAVPPPPQAKAPAPVPQEPPPAKPKDEALKAEVDRAAVALIIGGVEEQLLEWWPILEQHILNTDGEKGGKVAFSVAIEPDTEMGLRCRVGSSFSGSSLKRTWRAQVREGKDQARQLALFS